MTQLIVTLGTDCILFAFFSAVAFIVGYSILAKWWRSEIGWARVSLDFGIAVALSPTAIHVVTGVRIEGNVAFAWYQIGAVTFVGLVSLWNLALVARYQLKRQGRNGSTTDRDVRPS